MRNAAAARLALRQIEAEAHAALDGALVSHAVRNSLLNIIALARTLSESPSAATTNRRRRDGAAAGGERKKDATNLIH